MNLLVSEATEKLTKAGSGDEDLEMRKTDIEIENRISESGSKVQYYKKSLSICWKLVFHLVRRLQAKGLTA